MNPKPFATYAGCCATCALLLLGAACKSSDLPDTPRRGRPRGAIVAHAPEAREDDDDDQPGGHLPSAALREREPEPSAAPEAPAEEPEPSEQPKRDFSAELVSMMGDPTSCLQPRAADQGPPKISIRLRATVMPSGAVGSAEASAAELAASELACVKARLQSLRFRAPIENAPFYVSGTLELQKQAPAPSAQVGTDRAQPDEAPQPADPPGAVP